VTAIRRSNHHTYTIRIALEVAITQRPAFGLCDDGGKLLLRSIELDERDEGRPYASEKVVGCSSTTFEKPKPKYKREVTLHDATSTCIHSDNLAYVQSSTHSQ